MSQATPGIVCAMILSLVLIHYGTSAESAFNLKSKESAAQQPQLAGDLSSLEERSIPMDREDYHSNIELDKINDSHRYDMLDDSQSRVYSRMGLNNIGAKQLYAPESPEVWKFGRVVLNKSRLPSYYFGKRDFIYDATKEDKDYSFVGQSNNVNPEPYYAESFSGSSNWSPDFLRDLLIASKAQSR